ncbi:MAG: hypothetical protein C0498_10850 [Anaerolinea sp.]|nr:hypothetical protein [Anaerolinea sp.]
MYRETSGRTRALPEHGSLGTPPLGEPVSGLPPAALRPVLRSPVVIEHIHQIRGIHARPAPGFVGIGAWPRSDVAGSMNEIDQGAGTGRGEGISGRLAQEMGCLPAPTESRYAARAAPDAGRHSRQAR